MGTEEKLLTKAQLRAIREIKHSDRVLELHQDSHMQRDLKMREK